MLLKKNADKDFEKYCKGDRAGRMQIKLNGEKIYPVVSPKVWSSFNSFCPEELHSYGDITEYREFIEYRKCFIVFLEL